jgi:S-adenosyl methyltransferase
MSGVSESGDGSLDIPDVERLDTGTAHIARVYDYWLGGKDHFTADRVAGDEALEAFPGLISSVRANRAFLARAVRYLAAERGIRQFLDIGTGIPASSNTHEVAQSVAPEARVVYVDNDPMVLAHARALLGSGPHGATSYIDADLRDTGKILQGAAETIDFSQPVAVMLIAVLHLIRDEDNPRRIIAELMGAVPPGSSLSLSHVPSDMHMGQMSDMSGRLNRLLAQPSTYRSRAEVTGFFDGLEVAEPGVVPIQQWRPDTPEEASAVAAMWGGVALKL